MNDQLIIDNTHFREEEGKLICYTNLPDGDTFSQQVSTKEAVQKNMIGWCNTVREYMKVKEENLEFERAAAKARRMLDKKDVPAHAIPAPADTSAQPAAPTSEDPKAAVLDWYERTQLRIDQLGAEIEQLTEERNTLRDERDKIMPIIKAWKGVKGEESD